MSGSCAGAFVLAPLSSYLSENHGWRATVGLYAGKDFIIEVEIDNSKLLNPLNIRREKTFYFVVYIQL